MVESNVSMLKKLRKICGFALATCLLFPATATLAQDTISDSQSLIGSYTLGPGDVIDVRVFGETDLSGKLKLNEDGVIRYAFLGDFKLAGQTVSEVESMLDSTLRGDYLIDPRITVTVAEYRPFYVSGAVRRPGSYAYQLGLTVSKALSLAGGLNERASDKKIYLVPDGGQETERRKVELDDPIQPGDSLTVEESFF